MTNREIIKKYGVKRIWEMYYFLDKLNRYYAFPYSDITLCNFLDDLKEFGENNFDKCLKILEDRETSSPLMFNEIKAACVKSKQQVTQKPYVRLLQREKKETHA